MKRIVLLAALITLSTGAYAAEQLKLEPLHTVLSSQYKVGEASTFEQEQTSSQVKDGVYDATYTPAYQNGNMVPQNAAAEGKPVAEKPLPRVHVETKQGRRTNTQWNPGGKGTKSFF